MSELPSRYSERGLSPADQRRLITVGTPRKNRPTGAVKIEERVNDALIHRRETHPVRRERQPYQCDFEGDIPMIGMDDEEEVQIISNFVVEKREEPGFGSSFVNSHETSNRELTPESHQAREIIMVVDTNFMISHLDIVDTLAKLHAKYHHRIVIPVTVVKELDGLKSSTRTTEDLISGKTVGYLARWANDWMYRMLAENDSSVRAQKIREVTDKTATKDDAILDCCLYFRESKGALVVLLSNDKNLCMKALANEVLTVSYRKGMTADLIARKSFAENGGHVVEMQREDGEMDSFKPLKQPQGPPDPIDEDIEVEMTLVDLSEAAHLIYSEVQKLVFDAIDYCMYAEYEDDLDLIGYHKSQVLTLRDASQVLIRYWVSVFTEYFQGFRPFNGRRRVPVHVELPLTKEQLESFVQYWSQVLSALYMKRDERQNSALERIIQRWEQMSRSAT